jgi:uncharacterized protein (TIGR02145 family)
MTNTKNIIGAVSKGAKKLVIKSKNTVNDIKSAVGKVQQSAQIVEELALLDIELLRIKNYDLPTERNQINNDQKYFILGNDPINIQEDKNLAKNKAITSLEIYYNEKITTLEFQKQQLKDEYSKLNDGFYGLKKEKDQVDRKLKNDEKDEKINNQKNKIKFRPSFTEVIDGISFILSIIFEFISINNSKIEHLVDTTNEIISKTQTKSDLEAAKLSRDTALIIISSNRRQLDTINNILQFLELLTTILSSLINVLSLLPPLVITGATIRLLTKLDKILNDSSSLLSVANLVVSKLIDDLNYQESRLLQLGDILDNNITGLTTYTNYYVRAYYTEDVTDKTYYGFNNFFRTPIQITTFLPITGVVIGNQIWQSSNCNHDYYSDGTPIQQFSGSSASWARLTIGAWCWPSGFTDGSRGKLYNWYAIAGIWNAASLTTPSLRKQFAPPGWQVPTRENYNILSSYLLGTGYAGFKMKQSGKTTWSYSSGGTYPVTNFSSNSSGFTAIPAGFRDYNTYGGATAYNYLWTSDDVGGNAHIESLTFSANTLVENRIAKSVGASVRLINIQF